MSSINQTPNKGMVQSLKKSNLATPQQKLNSPSQQQSSATSSNTSISIQSNVHLKKN